MKLERLPLHPESRVGTVKAAVDAGWRLGLVTSIDGKQLLTLLIDPARGECILYETPARDSYPSLVPVLPQAHWFERTVFDMFGLEPHGHPRLKATHLGDRYAGLPLPLAPGNIPVASGTHQFMSIDSEETYEIPVGPIHAGIIEPGHFRFSCYGEIILNLEVQLGYVHRGVEVNIQNNDWRRARFVVEAAATDMPVANALAHALLLESISAIEMDEAVTLIRQVALEGERVAMHLADLIGLSGDVGFLAGASSFARLRGTALGIAETISGSRFWRYFICPGGISRSVAASRLETARTSLLELSGAFEEACSHVLRNQVLLDRMKGVGVVSGEFARDFGFVGLTARASGVAYDCRQASMASGRAFEALVETTGDVYARQNLRMREIRASISFMLNSLADLAEGVSSSRSQVVAAMPANQSAVSVVESHRGELIHLLTTDRSGSIERYMIKDASVNNWSALPIAVRRNLVADFPLCNKSFSLSYSGHDL